jgi:hypothetical protein
MRPRLAAFGILLSLASADAQVPDPVANLLQQGQYDLSGNGRSFLLREAADASFFMLGELHGENEIPDLIRAIWPAMWTAGYRHVAAEISPWAARELEFGDPSVRWWDCGRAPKLR